MSVMSVCQNRLCEKTRFDYCLVTGCSIMSCVVQVYAMPVYDMIEYQLVKHRVPNGFVTRLVYRTIYIVLVGFVAITLPFFGGATRSFVCG